MRRATSRPYETDFPFRSDGCSVVGPIAHFFGYENDAIAKCCLQHDKAYWLGGPLKFKWRADRDFRKCLKHSIKISHGWQKPFPSALARLMWLGVAIGGFIPHPRFRWGYGWKFPRYKGVEGMSTDVRA